MYETRLCGAPTEMYRDSKFYCETLFGPRTSDRRNVFNFSMLFSMVVLNACGITANVLIHRSVSVWNKAWGLVVANAIYVTEIVLVIVVIVNLDALSARAMARPRKRSSAISQGRRRARRTSSPWGGARPTHSRMDAPSPRALATTSAKTPET